MYVHIVCAYVVVARLHPPSQRRDALLQLEYAENLSIVCFLTQVLLIKI